MEATNGKPATAQPTLKELRQKQRLLETRLRVGQLERAATVLESLWSYPDSGYDAWWDLHPRVQRDGEGRLWFPLGSVSDRRHGSNYPFVQSEQDHSRFRDASRALCGMDSYAKGLLKNLTNYIVGKGYSYKAVPKAQPGIDPEVATATAAKVQAWLDGWRQRNRWARREREAFRRVCRDGEAFLRLFPQDDGTSLVRFVEPEQVFNPPGAVQGDGWTYGIRHQMEPFEDVETHLAYHVVYQDLTTAPAARDTTIGEEIPAAEIVHLRWPDEDLAVKRPIPPFSFGVLEAIRRASKLQRNLSVSSAIRAATAEIWQHAAGTQTQLQDFADSLATARQTNPLTGGQENIEHIAPGTVRRIPAGQTLVSPPSATGVGEQQQAVQGDLRQACAAFCAPEYMSGSTNDANYATAREAGAPFAQAADSDQDYFEESFLEVIRRTMAHAAANGALPPDTLALVDIQAEAPSVVYVDKLQKAQADQIKVQMRAKSPQTVSLEDGLDPETELTNLGELDDRFGVEGPPLPLPGHNDPADGGMHQGRPEGGAVSDLRSTVGGSQAIAALQQSYYAGEIPRAAAIASAKILFGFTDQEAENIFPEVAPVKLVPDENEEKGEGEELFREAVENVLLDVSDVRQKTGWSCGAACLLAVARYFGVGPDSEEAFWATAGTDPIAGTDPLGMMQALERLGLVCEGVSGLEPGELAEYLGHGHPILCPVQMHGGGHWVVVIGYQGSDLVLQDPVAGRARVAAEKFRSLWRDVDAEGRVYTHYGIAVGIADNKE